MTNGVKHGSTMAPILFSMMFSVMLTYAFQDCGAVSTIKYRLDGKLFNLRRLQTDMLGELLYADDLAENAS